MNTSCVSKASKPLPSFPAVSSCDVTDAMHLVFDDYGEYGNFENWTDDDGNDAPNSETYDDDDADCIALEEEDTVKIANELWHWYGGYEACQERRQTLWDLCSQDIDQYNERAANETREWLAWYELMAAQSFPPARIPSRDETKRRAGTLKNPPQTLPMRPIQLNSIKYDTEHGLMPRRNLQPLSQDLSSLQTIRAEYEVSDINDAM